MTTPLNDESRLNDKLKEALLYSIGCENAEIVSEGTDQLFDEYSEIVVPDSLDKWVSALITSVEKSERKEKVRKRTSRIGKRAAIILVALSLVSVITAMSVEAVRVKVLNMIIEVQEKYSKIQFEDADEDTVDSTDELPADWDGYYPTVLPEGYVLKDSSSHGEHKHLVFENSESKTMIFSQEPINVDAKLDTEGATVTDIEVNGMEGLLIVEDDYCIVFWHNSDNVFSLTGCAPASVLLEVAQSVIKK